MIHLFFYLGAVAVDAYLRSLPPQHETWEQWSARMAERRLGTIGDRRWQRGSEPRPGKGARPPCSDPS